MPEHVDDVVSLISLLVFHKTPKITSLFATILDGGSRQAINGLKVWQNSGHSFTEVALEADGVPFQGDMPEFRVLSKHVDLAEVLDLVGLEV